jgi:7-cyano-7-deazaguanine synthase
VLLSGGIDSATCLYLSKSEGILNRALTVRFYRIADREVEAAKTIAKAAGVKEHRFVSLPELREVGDMKRPGKLDGLPQAYIPMKNAIYYSVAAAFAEETGAERIVGGHNLEDTKIYEDTGDEFFGNLEKTLRSGSERLRTNGLTIWRPLRALDKPAVVSLATKLGVPLEATWSCHGEGEEHCWRCVGCLRREQAFVEAGVVDPLRAR